MPDVRRFSRTIDIAASPEQVWDVMSDVERWPEWTASMTTVERLDPSPLGVGSLVRVKQPRLATARFEITKWEPGRGFDWAAHNAAVSADARHLIERTPEGARLTLSVEFSGVLARVVAWWFGDLTERYIAMEAEGLKRRAESRASA